MGRAKGWFVYRNIQAFVTAIEDAHFLLPALADSWSSCLDIAHEGLPQHKVWGSNLGRVLLPTNHPSAPVPAWRNPETVILSFTQMNPVCTTNADGN